MEHGQFDALTRSVAGGTNTRRTVFRLLAGGALGSLMACLGLTEVIAAKPKHKKATSKPQRTSHAQRKPQDQLRAEGRGKGKGKGNKPHKKPKHPPPPPPDPPCPTDQGQCSDGSCVPFDQCCPDQYRCADGSCVFVFDCCPEEKRCSAELCILKDLCCPDEKKCADDVCYPKDDCCPEDIPPLCSECYEPVCGDNGTGTCRPIPGCCPENYVVCPSLLQWPGYYGGCCPAGHYARVNGRPFCDNTLGPRVYCDSATGQ